MKRIFKTLKAIEKKGQYYRLILSPESIDVKVYAKQPLNSKESNFCFNNDENGIFGMHFSLQTYLDNL